jgi:S-DNA-T family DNA segregation ATPase FtsK/SpoIIIE
VLQNKEKVNIDWHSQLSAVSREGLFLVLAVAAIYLLLALTSYTPDDPGWRQLNTNLQVVNLGGKSGAFMADLLFSVFGFSAYLLGVLPILNVWQRFRSPPVSFGILGWSWRLMGALLVLFSASLLIQLYDASESLPAGAGGALGSAVANPLTAQFGFVGVSLLGVLGLILGLTIYADVAWLASIDALGGATLRLIKRVFGKLLKAQSLLSKSPKKVTENTADTPPLPLPLVAGSQENTATDKPVLTPVMNAIRALPKAMVKPLKVTEKVPVLKDAVAPLPAKKIKIEPFEKKSQGQVQDSLFDVGEFPPISLLNRQQGVHETGYSPEKLEQMSRLLELKLKDFGVQIEVVAVNPGPVITRFEVQPAPGVKASKITGLAKDLARSLAMVSVRVVEVIPGKSVMGLEIPNENRAMVFLGDVLSSHEFQSNKSPLALALGHDIAGDPVTADVAKMPHLLVAGTTGSGKSVGVNSMLISILYKSAPEDVRLILVDPKMLELSVYDGIPHLLTPVITDMKEAANGLRWCVAEMERRYKIMASLGVRNLAGYNKKVLDAIEAGEPFKDPFWKAGESMEAEPSELGKLPYIVVVIDEFADMMMVVGKKVEELIARIAQKARAAGIHLILATQRPSVDVITGLIKANVPTRMAFQVSSRIDSRTILDQGGAEQLLGHGDMLYLPPGTSLPIRVHGAFVDDDEVHAVVADWKKRGTPVFIDSITDDSSGDGVPGMSSESDDGEADALFDDAIAFVTQTGKVSISSVQRKLRIGYNRAARLVESMEQAGVVSGPSQNGAREVLAPPPVPH